MEIRTAVSASDFVQARELFREYAAALEMDLCFQNFSQELESLPSMYGPPGGRLLLACEAEHPAGCVGLRRIQDATCEMKRLYVRPGFRRQGLGRALAWNIVQAAVELRYTRMRLDTLSSMEAAIALYESLGFARIPPYYHNPSAQAVFMERALDGIPQANCGAS